MQRSDAIQYLNALKLVIFQNGLSLAWLFRVFYIVNPCNRQKYQKAYKKMYYTLRKGFKKKTWKIPQRVQPPLPPFSWKKISLAKNDLYVMKQILYDMGLLVVARQFRESFEAEEFSSGENISHPPKNGEKVHLQMFFQAISSVFCLCVSQWKID